MLRFRERGSTKKNSHFSSGTTESLPQRYQAISSSTLGDYFAMVRFMAY